MERKEIGGIHAKRYRRLYITLPHLFGLSGKADYECSNCEDASFCEGFNCSLVFFKCYWLSNAFGQIRCQCLNANGGPQKMCFSQARGSSTQRNMSSVLAKKRKKRGRGPPLSSRHDFYCSLGIGCKVVICNLYDRSASLFNKSGYVPCYNLRRSRPPPATIESGRFAKSASMRAAATGLQQIDTISRRI